MATTNSTDKKLNSFLGSGEDNSGVSDWLYTNTGNKKKNKGLPVLNDTYTLSSGSGSVVVNAKLLDWNQSVVKLGSDIDGSLNSNQEYHVFGHPDKFVYDYQQDYNNCGVDSCLNVLSMAGKKDIIEVTPTYEQYLSTPIIKTKKTVEWNSETKTWEEKIEEVATYPKAPKETEDEFLLWAVQNSNNDRRWYENKYEGVGDVDVPEGEEIKDYTIHAKNYDEYKTIADLESSPTEVGGTTVIHRENILEYWGLETQSGVYDINLIPEPDTSSHPSGPVYGRHTDENGVEYITKTTTTTTNESIKARTVTTVVEYLNKELFESASPKEEIVFTDTTTVKENILNEELYNYLLGFQDLIAEGKGVILNGYANSFKGEKGGAHAITLVGLVRGEVDKSITEWKREKDGKVIGGSTTPETQEDIVGVYVIDTGGFLGNIEGAQFITLEQLYNFITDTTYEKGTIQKAINITEDNIRLWADNLNLVGNDRKNVLEGNSANNGIWGGKGNDVLYGNAGNDTLYGDQNNDTLFGGAGNDMLVGGSGDDTYIFQGDDGESNDLIITGSGKDSIQFDTTVLFDKELNNTVTYTIQDINNMRYQNRDGNLVIEYDAESSKGEKFLNNTITVKDYFKKSLFSSIKNIIEAVCNDGTYEVTKTYDFLKDFILRDYIDYYTYTQKANKITGTKFKDSIEGGNKDDIINAGSDDDIINGGARNDSIKAGSGDDTIYASYGNDKIYGEKGINTIIYDTNYNGNDTIYSGSGQDYINMTSVSKDSLKYAKSGNNLVVIYNDTDGSSLTITNYFNKKGKTSVKEIRMADNKTLDLVNGYQDILSQVVTNKTAKDMAVTGSYGYDYLKGGAGNDSLFGDLGNDTLYGGNGNDTLNGGYGSDKLYGQAGDNTYVFSDHAQGEDTIYYQGAGKSTLDFSSTDLIFSSNGVNGGIDTYGYTKSGNDLIINYAANIEEDGNSTIKISNYFKSKGTFEIKNADGSLLNLAKATIYMNGSDAKKNKITGSQYNDLIIGYDYNDVLKGGNGDDTITGGKGNDNITGGAGNNVIKYAKGDGQDIINLTKNEKLKIELTGFDEKDQITYEIVKNDLVISSVDEKKNTTKLLTLKNFGKKDVTTSNGSVDLYVNGSFKMDLREGAYLAAYDNFTPKKYKYTGTWHSEIIDASSLNKEVIKNNRGANINAGAGNDTIIGSEYNDTLNGGDGNDVIYTKTGKNTVNGGNGSDTYHIFEGIKEGIKEKEITTIKDTGKVAGDTDTLIINEAKENILFSKQTDSSRIYFNIDRNGNTTYNFNIVDKAGNTATVTGVEKIIANGGTAETTDDYQYNFTSEELKSAVVGWLTTNEFSDVNAAMKNAQADSRNELLAIFSNNDYWVQV